MVLMGSLFAAVGAAFGVGGCEFLNSGDEVGDSRTTVCTQRQHAATAEMKQVLESRPVGTKPQQQRHKR
jgi:hypothetical protein